MTNISNKKNENEQYISAETQTTRNEGEEPREETHGERAYLHTCIIIKRKLYGVATKR